MWEYLIVTVLGGACTNLRYSGRTAIQENLHGRDEMYALDVLGSYGWEMVIATALENEWHERIWIYHLKRPKV